MVDGGALVTILFLGEVSDDSHHAFRAFPDTLIETFCKTKHIT
jgi:hypothetical protein